MKISEDPLAKFDVPDLSDFPEIRADCSISRSLRVFGDSWSLLIIRESFLGACRFEEFHANLGIARNILTSRLKRLEEFGVLEKRPLRKGMKWSEYKLTKQGADLLPVVCALLQWGDRWLQDKGPPLLIVDRDHQKPIDDIQVTSGGKPLGIRDVSYAPGRRSPKRRSSQKKKTLR